MYRGYRVIDADSHIMEPDDLWEQYMDARYREFAPKTRCIVGDPPRVHFQLEIGSHTFHHRELGGSPYIPDGQGGLLTYAQAYEDFIADHFSPKAYLRYLEWRGLDYIVLYPSVSLLATAVPGLDPKVATAIKRAYNDWLYDFCNQGMGRLIGVGMLDLRDVDLAIAEAQRCVKELGFKALGILPDPPLPELPLNHDYYEPLWAAIEDLGVPLGIHEAAGHLLHPPGGEQIKNANIRYGMKAVSFHMGAMVTALVFCGGGICERHPNLKVVFTESTSGWVPSWLWYLDELWERFEALDEPGLTPKRPSDYFKRQCYVSAEPEEPGIKYVVDFLGSGENVVYNTDFPHPSEATVANPADEFLALEGIGESDKRRILWDNAANLYDVA